MSVHNPDPGDLFWDVGRSARLAYIGRDSNAETVFENIDQETDVSHFVIVSTDYAREFLAPWEDAPVTLAIGQVFDRSRNDYSNRHAVIIGVIDFRGTTHVVYDEIGGSGPNPKMKKEIDFRRVYGRLMQTPEVVLCPNCDHDTELHDKEGCTVTVPCEDPDFGDTQTCPCCTRGKHE